MLVVLQLTPEDVKGSWDGIGGSSALSANSSESERMVLFCLYPFRYEGWCVVGG